MAPVIKPTPTPTPVPKIIPTLIKSPTSYQNNYTRGSTFGFTAQATDWIDVNWHICYPNGAYYCEGTNYGYVDNTKQDISTLYILNTPMSLNGYLVYATFGNKDGSIDTAPAAINVIEPTPEPTQEPIISTHSIYVSNVSEGGDVSISTKVASPGAQVVIGAIPYEGWEVEYISVHTASNKDIYLDRVSPIDWAFEMPNEDVYISMGFMEMEEPVIIVQ